MGPRFEYKKARVQARFHVQVELVSVPHSAGTPGVVRIGARVIRVFRGAPDLRAGDVVEFAVSVCRQHDDIPAGAACWTNFDALRGARFMEVYLNGEPRNCSVALWQSTIIDTPCDIPALPCALAESLDELVDMLAAGCFPRGCVRARIGNHGQAAMVRLENTLQWLDAAPLEHQSILEDKETRPRQFHVGDDILTVYRDTIAIDFEGPPAVVLRAMYAMHGIPIAVDTVICYANLLTQAGENDGALFMLDLANLHPDRDRLGPTALVIKGMVISRLGDDATARALFQRADELLPLSGEGDYGRNAVSRGVDKYIVRAKDEDRAGRHRSAAALFGHAVTLLQQLVDEEGRDNLRAELAKTMIGEANARTQLGQGDAAMRLCNRAIALLEPMVQVQKRKGLEADLVRAKDVKHRAGLGGPPQPTH